MSTWISKGLMLAAALPLAACVEGGQPGAFGFRAPMVDKAAPLRRVGFFGGDVIVEGPDGYCVDGKSVRRRSSSGFALLTSCAHLARGDQGAVTPAVVTVSILPADRGVAQPSAAEISAGLAPAPTLTQINGDGISLVQLAQGGDRGIPGGDPRYWRAGMVINGHLIGLAAYGGTGSPVAGREGRRLLIEMSEHMRDASPRRSLPPLPAPEARPQEPAQAPAAKGDEASATVPVDHDKAEKAAEKPGGLRSILSGLFRKRS